MYRNLASALFLTERETTDLDENAPKIKGRIVTTLPKAKEIRPIVERAITLARRSIEHQDAANRFITSAKRNTEEWRAWRKSPQWQSWNAAIAPVLAARRQVLRMLGDKLAVKIVFAEIAPRFADRQGGYTRILRLAKPRLGDAGTRAILEFVGVNDRVKRQKAEKPSFGDEATTSAAAPESAPVTDEAST